MLELYRAEGCPHCAKVHDALAHQETTELGGQDPFLVDSEREGTLYESDDIVARGALRLAGAVTPGGGRRRGG